MRHDRYHQALKTAFPHKRRIKIDPRLWSCAHQLTPQIIDMIKQGMRNNDNRTLPLWLCIFAGVALTVLSLCLGPYKINWSQLAYDIAKDNQTIETIVFFELRIPRTIMCILTGVALGTGGPLYRLF